MSENCDLADIIPAERQEDLALSDDGSFSLRLIRERLIDDKCHFHLDLFNKGYVAIGEPNSTIEKIKEYFEKLVGKTLSVKFESRFLVTPKELPPNGLIKLFGSVGINFQGTQATLSGATIQLADSVYRELRWKPASPASDGTKRYWLELGGTLGPVSVSDDLLNIVRDRILAGLERFVIPKQPVVRPKAK